MLEITYCVPNLKLDDLIVDSEAEAAELDANRHLMLTLELIIHNSLHEARLADTGISNNNKFKQMVLRAERLVADDLIRHLHKLLYFELLHFFIFKKYSILLD
jgi:hypothetical protein